MAEWFKVFVLKTNVYSYRGFESHSFLFNYFGNSSSTLIVIFMFLSIILLPFFAFCISSIFGRFIGKKGSSILTISFMGFVIILSVVSFFNVGIKNDIYFIDLGM